MALWAIAADPLTNFSERTLFDIRFAHQGARGASQSCTWICCRPRLSWQVFIGSPPHSLAPSLAEIFEANSTLRSDRFRGRVPTSDRVRGAP